MGQVVVFAIFLGIATIVLPSDKRERLEPLFGSAAELFRTLVTLILRFAPLGIGALAATTVVGAVMLLLLSLSYGSLPILASFGLQLSEETT